MQFALHVICREFRDHLTFGGINLKSFQSILKVNHGLPQTEQTRNRSQLLKISHCLHEIDQPDSATNAQQVQTGAGTKGLSGIAGRFASTRARLLIYCADYKCSHSIRISTDRWPDDVRLSDLEDRFTWHGVRRARRRRQARLRLGQEGGSSPDGIIADPRPLPNCRAAARLP